ncbi:hypothetical protein VKT23_006705 [Stygiomarasmius scandens]|uniref:C2H2-type domain-containing protein n=1 Tax=Marasmiellus scandens TaxID=2682957 RepID=A0ABR1ISG9_9AGAR
MSRPSNHVVDAGPCYVFPYPSSPTCYISSNLGSYTELGITDVLFRSAESPMQFTASKIGVLHTQNNDEDGASHGRGNIPNDINPQSDITPPSSVHLANILSIPLAEKGAVQWSAYQEISNGENSAEYVFPHADQLLGGSMIPYLVYTSEETDHYRAPMYHAAGNATVVTFENNIRAQVGTNALVEASRLRRKEPERRGRYICHLCGRDFTANHNLKSMPLTCSISAFHFQ